MVSRRDLGTIGLLALALPAAAPVAGARPPVLVVQTFLQALPGRRAQLGEFLTRNWLAMDRRAIDAGLFSHATLYDVAVATGDAAAPTADFAVEVGYLTPGGYADVAEAFGRIRAAHTTVLVDGLGLRELGRIVGERQLRVAATS
ncbi:MAG: hypothetical protein INF91_08695 [Alphaproteobacteria bacterium]|nr:hypothetical protein [Alphaproteobacteria bacterium]